MTKRLRILALGMMIVVLLATLSGCSEQMGSIKDAVMGVKDKVVAILTPYLPGCEHEGGEATCTEQAVCVKCGEAYGDVLGHDIVVDAAVAPDCTNTGLTEGKHCSRCDYVSGQEAVDALGHNEVVDAAVPATCYSTGLTEGKHCDRCGEVLVAQTTTTMIPHTYDEEGFDETCNAEGCTHVRTCAHEGEKITVKGFAATCTTAGLTDGEKCAICGDVTKAQEVIDALSHDMADATCTQPATCKREGCSHTVGAAKGHSYNGGVVTTAPTCTEKGVKTFTCTVAGCGHSYTEEVAAAGHSYNSVVIPPTCTAAGYTTYTCHCGDTYTVDGEAATGHAWDNGVVTTPATCTSVGVRTYTCGTCQETKTEEIALAAHTEVQHEAKAPTCTTIGWDAYVTCSKCNYTTYVEKEALDHDLKDVAKKDATCFEAGYEAYKACTRCDYTEGYTAIDKRNHVDADSNGYCDYEDCRTNLCMGNHEYVQSGKLPTCTEAGLTFVNICIKCGTVENNAVQNVRPALGHDFSVKDEVVAPTFDNRGYTVYSCSRCDKTEIRDYTDKLVAVATVGDQKYTTLQGAFDAAVDGATITLVADIKLSKYLDVYTENNGEIARSLTLNLNGHSITPADDYKVTDYSLVFVGINQTLTIVGEGTISAHAGVTLGVYGTLNLTSGTVVNTGKTEKDGALCVWYWNHDDAGYNGIVGGNCYVTGGKVEGAVYVDEPDADGQATLVISGGRFTTDVSAWLADGYHLAKDGLVGKHVYTTKVTAPTCTEKGYTTYTCSCGASYNADYVDAKGHSWNNGDVTTAPTCTEKGVKTYTCANCGGTKTEDIDALGHNYEGKVPHKDATCTEAGVVGGTYCTSCNEGKEAAEATITALGHNTEGTVAHKDATCTATGVVGGTYCTRCNDGKEAAEATIPATGHTTPNADGLCDNCDIPLTNEAILKALYALESGKSLTGKYTLTGVITKIDTAYSSQYKNVTVTIVVDGLTEYPVQCYRMKGTGADTIKVGDTITVTGTLKNYNGTKEYDTGCTLDSYTAGHTCVGKYACSENCVYCGTAITPAEIHIYDEFGVCQCGAAKHTHVDADLDFNCDVEGCDETVIPEAGTKLTVAQAIALGKLYGDNQYTTGEYVISGTVTKIHETWNTQYNNMSVYITDETGSILVYRLKAQVGVGDKITVTGKVGTYGVTQQIKEATGVIDEAHVCSDYTEATCEKLAECKVCGATTGELAEHTYGDDNICDVCGNPKGVETVTVTKTNSEIAGIAGVTMGQNSGVISNKNIALDSYISIVCAKGSASSDPCIYSDSVRLYQAGAKITISASAGANLDTIVINCGTQYGNDLLTVSGGTISRNGSVLTIVVNDDATTVTITTGGSDKNTDRLYITSIEVSYTVEPHVCEENVENVAEVPATCEKAGTTAGTKCSKCGTILSGCEEVKALGHDWNDWTVTKEAKCGVAGEETRTCKNDATHKETKAVAALEHNYVGGKCEYCGEAENQGGTTPQSTSVKFDFANSKTNSNSTALTQANLKTLLGSVYEGEVGFTVGSTLKYVYSGNSSGGPAQTNKLLKMGKSSNGGEFSLTFDGRKVTKVVINCQNWGSTKTNKIAVNGMAGVIAPQASAGDVTFELTSPTNTIKITTTERVVIYSITIYFE